MPTRYVSRNRTTLFAGVFALATAPAFAAGPPPWCGRWDLTLHNGKEEVGGWLEVTPTTLRIVPRVGGVRPVPKFDLHDDHLTFSDVEWLGKWERVTYRLELQRDRLTGTAEPDSGPAMTVIGARAPELDRHVGAWGRPVKLDLSAFKVYSPTKPGNWRESDGTISNSRKGPNLRTIGEYQDFRLDLEFNCPAGSNSGVFLRGRYEIQIEEEPQTADAIERTGSVYHFLAPRIVVPRRPGEWRRLSVALVGRTVTVVLDGETLIDRQEIPGPTSGGFNSREAEPGPIILQGDHGPVAFRNIILTPAEAR